jgi:hypothetical protein
MHIFKLEPLIVISMCWFAALWMDIYRYGQRTQGAGPYLFGMFLITFLAFAFVKKSKRLEKLLIKPEHRAEEINPLFHIGVLLIWGAILVYSGYKLLIHLMEN